MNEALDDLDQEYMGKFFPFTEYLIIVIRLWYLKDCSSGYTSAYDLQTSRIEAFGVLYSFTSK